MSVPTASLIALGFGACIAIIGIFLLLIAAFRQSIVWGLVALFVPLGAVVYTCLHWADAKTGFLANLIGSCICCAGLFSIPMVQQQLWTSIATTHAAAPAAPNLDQEIQEQRQKIESLQGTFAQDGVEMTRQYRTLEAQRKALKPADAVAITKFNQDAAAYQTRNLHRKQMQQDLDNAQKQLDALLETRSRNATASNR